MRLPDPNTFGNPAGIWRADGAREWEHLPVGGGFAGAGRGIGLAEMARAIDTGRPHRASGELACHVLEVLLAIDHAVRGGGPIAISTTAPAVRLVPLGVDVGAE
jgi:predicted dehydrogenase